ncbi:interleukin-17 receptor A [Cyprinodon tularosa]|uniref:interleukin-17 receptor A n=1 Tax=Cyprinodon tularosa TaxID=77115 RepID=UPI0018E2233F|nr:interleukin-17 receptor A [Cyprinodon tularosa]
MIYAMMIILSLFIFSLLVGPTASTTSSLRILNFLCNQTGLSNCKISNCLDMDKVPPLDSCTGPLWDSVKIKTSMDLDGIVPVVNVGWKLQADASISIILGSEIKVIDENTNQSVCVQFRFSIINVLNPNYEKWNFSLDVVVEPEHTYTLEVFNFPESEKGHHRITGNITVPGCEDKRIKEAQLCQENGSLWDPKITAVASENKNMVFVGFNSSEYSERYRVLIQSGNRNCSEWVSKENRTFLNVTLICDLSPGETIIMIQPVFIRCKTNCKTVRKSVRLWQTQERSWSFQISIGLLLIFVCFLVYLLHKASHEGSQTTPTSADNQQPEIFQVQERKRVLILYSLDHLLYKNIVLKFSAFLAAKCGTDVILDLLDLTRLGVLGSIQWLEWHKERIESSSDKILILCSQGVQVKWRAMCGGQQVFLKEDALSPVGDTLTPSLTLLVPHFIRAASFEKYIVAYFDDVCSEEDIPLPFKITVRYKLMKQFEEVFFRILNTEKHEPGRVKRIDGLSEDTYHECPSGRALRDAIEAFRRYQSEHPDWFQEELLEGPELEDDEARNENNISKTDQVKYYLLNSVQIISDMTFQDSIMTVKKTMVQLTEPHQMCSTLEFNSHTEGIQLL